MDGESGIINSALGALSAWPAVLALLVACGSSGTDASPEDRAHSLEGRLIAPCCWTQTLDVHDSPEAAALREEIATRLRGGESTEAIERSLVERYGERIVAVPRDRDPRGYLGFGVGLGMLVTLVGLVSLGRRWRAPPSAPAPSASDGPDPYDARLERELAARADDD